MARQSLLTNSQCEKIRQLKAGGARAVDLAKKFKVSESSLYKVLDGSYIARADGRKNIPVVTAIKPHGATPSLFESGNARSQHDMHPVLAQLMDKAHEIDEIEIDDVTLAAAELVIAKAKLDRLVHAH